MEDLFNTIAKITKPVRYEYEVRYNNRNCGKVYFTRKEAKKEVKRLHDLGLWGYTVCKY